MTDAFIRAPGVAGGALFELWAAHWSAESGQWYRWGYYSNREQAERVASLFDFRIIDEPVALEFANQYRTILRPSSTAASSPARDPREDPRPA